MGVEKSSLSRSAEDQRIEQAFPEFLQQYKQTASRKSSKENFVKEDKVVEDWKEKFRRAVREKTVKDWQKPYADSLLEAINIMPGDSWVRAQSIIREMRAKDIQDVLSRQVFRDSSHIERCQRLSQNVIVGHRSNPVIPQAPPTITAVYSVSVGGQKSPKLKTVKNITYILVRQLCQSYHPVRFLKQSFIHEFENRYILQLTKTSEDREKALESLFEKMHQDIKYYCSVIVDACSGYYKQWAIKKADLRPERYGRLINDVVTLSLFVKADMYEAMFLLLRSALFSQIRQQVNKIPGKLEIKDQKLGLRPELQIDGQYNRSLAILGKLPPLTHPKYIIRALQNLKYQICNDIDDYHTGKGQPIKQKIDSDDLLAIVAYLLVRSRDFLLAIALQLKILCIVYGQEIHTSFQDASYMHSVMETAFGMLQSHS